MISSLVNLWLVLPLFVKIIISVLATGIIIFLCVRFRAIRILMLLTGLGIGGYFVVIIIMQKSTSFSLFMHKYGFWLLFAVALIVIIRLLVKYLRVMLILTLLIVLGFVANYFIHSGFNVLAFMTHTWQNFVSFLINLWIAFYPILKIIGKIILEVILIPLGIALISFFLGLALSSLIALTGKEPYYVEIDHQVEKKLEKKDLSWKISRMIERIKYFRTQLCISFFIPTIPATFLAIAFVRNHNYITQGVLSVLYNILLAYITLYLPISFIANSIRKMKEFYPQNQNFSVFGGLAFKSLFSSWSISGKIRKFIGGYLDRMHGAEIENAVSGFKVGVYNFVSGKQIDYQYVRGCIIAKVMSELEVINPIVIFLISLFIYATLLALTIALWFIAFPNWVANIYALPTGIIGGIVLIFLRILLRSVDRER